MSWLMEPDGTVMCISMGKLIEEQEAVVRNYVNGVHVHDLGAGQLGLTKQLLNFGASTVTAVDKDYEYRLNEYPQIPNVTLVGEYFEEYARHGHHIDVAFVSWPEMYQQEGLVRLLCGARIVIYLGSNLDGTVCGSEDMWLYLTKREVLATVPHRWNSLIVYGPRLITRSSLPEERAALHRAEGIVCYRDAYGSV